MYQAMKTSTVLHGKLGHCLKVLLKIRATRMHTEYKNLIYLNTL